jgi:ribosome biogenesis protein YTM1
MRLIMQEAVLDVEYVPAVVPPKQRHSAPHDDWVSAVQGMGSSSSEGSQTAVTGSYDGCLRVWDSAGERVNA